MKLKKFSTVLLTTIFIFSMPFTLVCCNSDAQEITGQNDKKHEIAQNNQNDDDILNVPPMTQFPEENRGIIPIPNLPKGPRGEYDNPFIPPQNLFGKIEIPDLPLIIHPVSNRKFTSIWRYMDETKADLLVIEFWAVWNESAKAELPYLELLGRNYKNNGLRVLGVSIDSDGSNIENKINDILEYDYSMDKSWRNLGKYPKSDGKTYLSFPIAVDGKREILNSLGLENIPTTILVTADHKVFAKITGLDEEKMKFLEDKVKECLSIK